MAGNANSKQRLQSMAAPGPYLRLHLCRGSDDIFSHVNAPQNRVELLR